MSLMITRGGNSQTRGAIKMGDSWARMTTSPAAVLELKGREAGRVLACRLRLKEEQAEQFTAPVSKGGHLGSGNSRTQLARPTRSSPSTPTATGEAGEPCGSEVTTAFTARPAA